MILKRNPVRFVAISLKPGQILKTDTAVWSGYKVENLRELVEDLNKTPYNHGDYGWSPIGECIHSNGAGIEAYYEPNFNKWGEVSL